MATKVVNLSTRQEQIFSLYIVEESGGGSDHAWSLVAAETADKAAEKVKGTHKLVGQVIEVTKVDLEKLAMSPVLITIEDDEAYYE